MSELLEQQMRQLKLGGMAKEWRRVWKKRRAERRRARRLRKFNALTNKRNKITKKIKKLQQGG